ncbi:MAG TPA: glycogen synthase [Chitinivibrionales bacterium]
MYITMIASECAPAAKVGGLADVVFGLSKNLHERGHTVEIILPRYDCLRYDTIAGLAITYKDLFVPWNRGAIRCTVWQGAIQGQSCFFIESHSPENFFTRRVVYGCPDDGMRFAFFSKAALEFLYKTKKRPDVIHCHDWMTGLVPVMLYELYQSQGMESVHIGITIHNFRHQGIVGENILPATGLGRPEYFFRPEVMRDPGNPRALNFMKAGIVYSNFVTTVSPQYAWEAMYANQGCGLESLLIKYSGKFQGVLNGLDYDSWNPHIDRHLPVTYTADSLAEKNNSKALLYERLHMRSDAKPLIAFIGRLDEQKGIPLIRHTLFYALKHGAQFVLLGTSPDARINAEFSAVKRQIGENPDCAIELRFDEELAHLIYAGADFMIVPSLYEPCGLTQVIALKYGTVPIVREVGGLVNTVFDWDYSTQPLGQRNGFSFRHTDAAAIESALYRALNIWYNNPQDFQTLQKNGMSFDFSWNMPAQIYLEIYMRITSSERNPTP